MGKSELILHLEWLFVEASHAPPEMARLVYRSGGFRICSKSAMHLHDILVCTLTSEDCIKGPDSKLWSEIFNKVCKITGDNFNDKNNQNTNRNRV